MKGKQKRFVDLMYEHQGILHRICPIYASSPADREDLYQEILMQTWRSFDTFNRQSKFSTWLYRVALNTALLHRRKHFSRREVFSETSAGADIATHDAADEPDVRALRQCIQELPRLDRAIILLYLEQHTYQEIADITGLSRGNVSVRVVRIKDKLRRRLLAKGYHEE